jgi:hypothetical protein
MSNFMDWGTHMPMLIKLIPITMGDILEMGMGWYSTPLLHWISMDQNRKLVSYENDKEYYDIFKDAKNDLHEISYVEAWEDAHIKKEWGVAFIDFRPKIERRKAVRDLANLAKFIIIHDTDPRSEKFYGYNKIYPLFKYRFDYTIDHFVID